MTQTLKPGYTLHSRPNILLEYPNHATGIALVVTEWVALEEQIFFSFNFALLAFDPKEHASQRVAQNAWDAMESVRARLDFISNIAERKLPANLFNSWDKKIKPEIAKRAAERNKVVHGRWFFCNQYPEDIILSNRGKNLRYSVKDFHEIAARIIATANKTANYWSHVKEQLYPGPK